MRCSRSPRSTTSSRERSAARTERIDFLDSTDDFFEAVGVVHRTGATCADTASLPRSADTLAVVLDAP